jgi:hypothetical protein
VDNEMSVEKIAMRVLKWTLSVTDFQTLELPTGAVILSVQVQHDKPQLWALCDENVTTVQMRFIAIYGTGNTIHGNAGRYISTFQMRGGDLVFHAFEVNRDEL